MSAATPIPHVSDLHRLRLEQQAEQERIERLGRRPAVPIPNTIDELHAYIVSDDPVKLRTWMEGNYPPIKNAIGAQIHDYPAGQGDALNLLVSLHNQCQFPSSYATESADVDAVVERHHGDPLWQWCYLRAYADHVIREKQLGNATRANLRAVLDRIKPLEPFALKQAQNALHSFH